ncbi:MAG: tetratricopeptide repeat protein [Planctomycetota bacterium]|nr:tetratricopeptide repeat protein [Planctomycetota bacterium]
MSFHVQRNFVAALILSAACLMIAPLARAQTPEEQAAIRDFNTTAALQNSGFYERAGEKWVTFIAKYPKDARLDRVHYFLGICQLHNKKYPDAIKSFQTVLTSFPTSKSADGCQYNLGMAHFQTGQVAKTPAEFQAAAAAFSLVVTKYATSRHAPAALYYQGEALYLAADVKGAVEAYKALVAKYPTSPLLGDAYYALGTAQQELTLIQDAATTYQAFLAKPELAQHELANEVRLRLGLSLYDLGKYADAEALFTAVVAVPEFPHADFALLRQAQCRVETAKHAEAAVLFVELTKKFPQSTYLNVANLAAGKCYYLTDKLNEARTSLDPLSKANQPESAEAAYWLGRTLLKLQDPAAALAALDPAVNAFKTGDFAAYLQAARIDALYELPDRRKETAPLYANFVKQFPEHPLAAQSQYMAALASLGQEDFTAARTNAEAFLANAKLAMHELRPAVLFIAAEGHLLAAQAGDKTADQARAEALYRELVAKSPQHVNVPRSQLRIGWLLLQTNKHEEAITHLVATMASFTEPDQKAEAQLLIGRGHTAAMRHKEATTAFTAALQVSPTWARGDEALILLSQSFRAQDDAVSADTQLKLLLTKYPASTFLPQAIYDIAEIAYQQEKHDEAIARYTEFNQKFAAHELAPRATYGLGLAYFAKQDFPNTVIATTALLTGHAQSEVAPSGQYLRGLANQRLQQFAPAAQDFTAFLATNPMGDELLDSRYALALCQIGLKQFPQATVSLTALLTDKPDYAHADKVYYEMAHALVAQDKAAEAAAAFGAITTKLPDSPLAPECWFHVGRHHESLADKAEGDAAKAPLAEAAKAFAAGLAKAESPELQEKLRYKLGDMQFRQQQYPQAAATLLEQIAKHPTGELVGPARFLAAECLFRQDQFPQARPLFEQVAADKVEKYTEQALFRAGICAANQSDWPVSQTHYTSLITQFPKSEQLNEARYGVGWALQNQNKLAEARAAYILIGQVSGTEVEAKAQFMLGEIDFAEKKYPAAIEHFLTVAVGYPYKTWQAMAQFETGRCFVELAEKEKAINAFQVVIDKHADHAKAKDAATLIAELKK